MAKERVEKEAIETPEEVPKKKKGKLLIILLAVIVLLAGVAVGAYFFLFSKNQEGEKAVFSKKTQEASGVNFSFEPFVVNLMDAGGTKYLKVSIQIELSDAKFIEKAKNRTPQIRDAIIILITNKTSEELITAEGKIILKDEIKQRANQILGEGTVLNVYLTDFVMQ
jgi:flagellar FliL protein